MPSRHPGGYVQKAAVGLAAALLPLALVPGDAHAGLAQLHETTAQKGQSLVEQALANAGKEAGVDYTSTSSLMTDSDTDKVQAGRTGGLSDMSLREGKLTGHFSAVLMGSNVYVDGDLHGLQSVGFNASAAGKEAGKWVEVPSQGAQAVAQVFRVVSGTLTVPSVISGIGMSGPFTLTATKKLDGQTVVGVKGESTSQSAPVPDTLVLYVSTGGPPLPLEAVFTGTQGNPDVTVNFTKWGSQPKLRAPKGAVKFQASWGNK